MTSKGEQQGKQRIEMTAWCILSNDIQLSDELLNKSGVFLTLLRRQMNESKQVLFDRASSLFEHFGFTALARRFRATLEKKCHDK